MKYFLVVLTALVMISCSPQEDQSQTTVTTGERGLDLTALTAIAKQCRTAQELEEKLNTNGSINNLDLDEDGNVDYVHVTEYANNGVKGFSLYVDKGQDKQEVATIEITQQANQANVTVAGNQNIYGQGAYYQSSFTATDFLLWSYLLNAHPYYYSPYHYGYYPGYYRTWRTYDYDTYRSRYRGYHSNVVVHKTVINNYRSSSPNRSYSSSKYTPYRSSSSKSNWYGGSSYRSSGSSSSSGSSYRSSSSSRSSGSSYRSSSSSRSSGSSYRSSSRR